MPKNTVEKNSKGNKKNTTKKNTVKKVETKKTEVKKVETKKVVKPIAKKTKKKGNIKAYIKNTIDKIINNTPFAISLCIICLLIATLIFVLCTKKVPKTKDGDEIVASLNGKNITAQELYESLKETYGANELVNLIDEYIAEKEVTITKEDEKYVDEVVDYYKEYAEYYGTDLATFLANYVGLSGISTEDEFRTFVLEDYKKTLAVQKFVADSATEDELKEFYKENYSDKLTVKHILIEVDSEAEDKEAADKEAYDKAMSLIKKLDKIDSKKLDKEFGKLAEKNSDDTATFSNGGLIENFTKSDVVEEFFNAANELKDGEYTDKPVKSSYGYHIILKVSSTPVEKYKDIKDEVKRNYAETLLSSDTALQATKWDELRKQYKLSIEDDFIKEIYKNTIKETTKTKTEE